MAIYLIDKIKPKNNGSFPMVDAEDVLMPDGTRLSGFKGGVTSFNGQTGDVTISVTNGKDGQDGQDGADGKDGVSPSVTITAITGGHRITITDATGTKSFDVMDGEDGKDGQDGDSASITVDSELSETSENPVQNKAIVAYLATLVEEFSTALSQLSQTIPTDEHINTLIDAKLGVIENGTY